jgi:hypothetical protein
MDGHGPTQCAGSPGATALARLPSRPAYVDCDEFAANQRQLANNVSRYDKDQPEPRTALLPGLLIACWRGDDPTLGASGPTDGCTH